jgi:hypothetical protein
MSGLERARAKAWVHPVAGEVALRGGALGRRRPIREPPFVQMVGKMIPGRRWRSKKPHEEEERKPHIDDHTESKSIKSNPTTSKIKKTLESPTLAPPARAHIENARIRVGGAGRLAACGGGRAEPGELLCTAPLALR